MDKIYLNNLQFYGYHGLFEAEKELGQRFNVDVVLHTDLQQAGLSDRMEDSIHYGEAYETVRSVVEGKAKSLIEAVAEQITVDLLKQFSTLQACRVKVVKPNPPIAGHYDSVAVEIFRERKA